MKEHFWGWGVLIGSCWLHVGGPIAAEWQTQRENCLLEHMPLASLSNMASPQPAQVEYILISHSLAKLPQFIQIIVLPFV